MKNPPERLSPEALHIPTSLVSATREYLDSSRAVNTMQAYRTDWERFSAWCQGMGLSAMPAEPSTVALYLTARAEEGRKPSVLSRELAAISVVHRMQSQPSPRGDVLVREVMQGIRRKRGVAQRMATPILPKDLKKISAQAAESLTGLRDRALFLLGFAGALRRSELCAMRVENVAFVEDGMTILLRRSKTDQEGRGETKGIPYGSDPMTCPVRAVKAWLSASKIESGWLFRGISRHETIALTPLTGRSVSRLLKTYAAEVGLEANTVSGHSLRSGLATAAARAGKSPQSIMRQTGHKSLNMVNRYIREANLFNENAASGIGL